MKLRIAVVLGGLLLAGCRERCNKHVDGDLGLCCDGRLQQTDLDELETLPLIVHEPGGVRIIEVPLDLTDPPEERRLRGLMRGWGAMMQDNPNWCIGICGPDNQHPRCCRANLFSGKDADNVEIGLDWEEKP